MPSFNLLLMDSSSRLNTNSIPIGQPTIFLFFDPACPFCQALTKEITNNIKSFSNTQFYFLSPYPFKQIKSYYTYYKIDKYPNITFGRDYDYFFANYYKANRVPYIAIYGKNKRLKKIIIGTTSTDVIKKIALE